MTKMAGKWLKSLVVVLVIAAAAADVPISDELFYRAPRLFRMDDFDKCQFQNATFCMGVFEITPEGERGYKLYQEMIKVSENGFRQNRSVIHRASCLAPRDEEQDLSAELKEEDPVVKFERCVNRELKKYEWHARLKKLQYCKSKQNAGIRKRDLTDWLVAAVIGIIIFMNVIGTLYDLKKDPCVKPNKFLMAWSLRSNWSRLTAVHSGDQRLDALAPIHGIKAHMIILTIFAHATFAMTMVYPHDEREVDEISDSIAGTIGSNGTIFVQTFTMVSSFLLGYMLLISFEKAKMSPSITHWPSIVFSRYMRMAPSLLFVVGLTATWIAGFASGPMWYLVEEMESACRKKWWSQLLFINNIVAPDDRCLIQSWFFAVEMQLFMGAVILALLLASRPRRALRVIGALYVLTLGVNFALNLSWKMQPVVKFATTDNVRTMAVGVDSYTWMFSAPWTSVPSNLHGLFLAFLKYQLDKTGFKPDKHKWITKTTYIVYGCMIAWLLGGDLVKRTDDPFWLAVYATLDRNVTNLMVTFLVFAYIHGQGGFVVPYLSWGGFQIMSRVVFPAMLVHWHVNLMSVAAYPAPVHVTFNTVMLNLMSSIVVTTMFSIPLHLLVELPMQRMLS
ncbi:nose resistant to fluoxetine protein 6 [Amyelois transitella]|uniref:nose resistant to fluoxetine protein 6 n=1 Tax=Amyelois transitella TaxID=680683 RepID=UPI00298F8E18|nr:nose resistant to fluoxetine protein 6 [Amyelois transitella]